MDNNKSNTSFYYFGNEQYPATFKITPVQVIETCRTLVDFAHESSEILPEKVKQAIKMLENITIPMKNYSTVSLW